MKVHKLDVLVVDPDELGADEIKCVIENTKYPNWCIYPEVMGVETRDVEWSEDHPLNKVSTTAEEYKRLFEPGSEDGKPE